MVFKKVESEKLSDKVFRQFEEMLSSGKLKPGDRLPNEKDLAAMFCVSRGILREALMKIESMGYISRKPKGGTFIRDLAEKEYTGNRLVEVLRQATYNDLLEVRETLEQRIVELAVERATEEDIREIERILENSEKIAVYDSNLDCEFHQNIAAVTQNSILINFMAAQHDLISEISNRTSSNKERSAQILKEHKDILCAIKERDAGKAKSAVLYHLRNIRKSIEASFKAN